MSSTGRVGKLPAVADHLEHDEWTEGRRYLGLDVLARSRISLAPAVTEVTPDTSLQALSAQPKARGSRANRKHHATGLDPSIAAPQAGHCALSH